MRWTAPMVVLVTTEGPSGRSWLTISDTHLFFFDEFRSTFLFFLCINLAHLHTQLLKNHISRVNFLTTNQAEFLDHFACSCTTDFASRFDIADTAQMEIGSKAFKFLLKKIVCRFLRNAMSSSHLTFSAKVLAVGIP